MELKIEYLNKLNKVLKTPEGEEFLRILDELFYNKISFEPDNMYLTAFNEGHRDIIQFLHNVQHKWERRENGRK